MIFSKKNKKKTACGRVIPAKVPAGEAMCQE
jgi:hypothetical protein